MSETKWTPGPWVSERYNDGRAIGVYCSDITGSIVASVGGFSAVHRLPVTDDANARLIAAAPELYWWLKSIIDDLPEHRDWLDPDVEASARAALAKARGEA